jgi:uncharacterized protein
VRRTAPPLPLGFLALAAGTLLLATLNLGWLEPADGGDVAVALLAFVAPLQGTASIMGFLSGEVVPATAMGILAGTWATTGIVILGAPPGATSGALGTQLLLTSGAMAVAAAMAFARGAVLPGAVIAGASARFALTGVYELTADVGWERAAGWVGLPLAVFAAAVAATLGLEAARGERRAS